MLPTILSISMVNGFWGLTRSECSLRYRVSDDFLEAEGIDAWLVGEG